MRCGDSSALRVSRLLARPTHWIRCATILSIVLHIGRTEVAQAQAPTCQPEQHRVLLVSVPADLVARIKGQTHDLCLQLVTSEQRGTEPVTEQTARRLADQEQAVLAVWVDDDESGLKLSVYDAVHGALSVREFPLTRQDRSAQLEAVAVAVRSTLQMLGEEARQRRAVDARVAPAEPSRAPRLPPATAHKTDIPESSRASKPGRQTEEVSSAGSDAHEAKSGERPPGEAHASQHAMTEHEPLRRDHVVSGNPASAGLRAASRNSASEIPSEASDTSWLPAFQFSAGILALADGVSDHGLWGGWLEPQVQWAQAFVALRFEHSLEGSADDKLVKLGIVRRAAWLVAGVPVHILSNADLSPRLGVGYVQHVRHTRGVDDSLLPKPSVRSAGAAFELGLAWNMTVLDLHDVRFGFSLGAAAQLLLVAPVFRYQSGGETVDQTLSHVCPAGYLGLFVN